MNTIQQRKYFDIQFHRYALALLKRPPKHVQTEIDLLIKKVQKNSIRKLADFGSGNGRVTIPLLQRGYAITAIDISSSSLEELKRNARILNCSKKLRCKTMLSNKCKYDAIVGADVLHHVDMGKVLPQIYNSLTKKGLIVFSEPNILNLAWSVFISLFLNWKIEWRIIFCNYFSLERELRRAGFNNINIHGLGFFPLPFGNCSSLLHRLNVVLGSLPIIKLFAYRFILYATKTP